VRVALVILAALILGGCAGARYGVRLEGWGMQVELSVDTREADERRAANGAPVTLRE